jgi:hypothetical protein
LQSLLQQFDGAATQLPRSLDFGDSYADVVLHGETIGGAPVVTFFQMDKRTRGLKRIQLERPRRGVNPPALRAISAALQADYGRPDKICLTPVSPIGGYQAAAQEVWVRGTDAISAIYRDTTLQTFEGCLFGVASGYCGLTGQLLVRIDVACTMNPVTVGASAPPRIPAEILDGTQGCRAVGRCSDGSQGEEHRGRDSHNRHHVTRSFGSHEGEHRHCH